MISKICLLLKWRGCSWSGSHARGIPFQVIRVISDETNESSHEDFNLFLSKYCNSSAEIIVELIKNINNKDF